MSSDRITLLRNSPEYIRNLLTGQKSLQPAADPELVNFFGGDDVSQEFLTELERSQGEDPWRWGFLVLADDPERAVGTVGFKGPPDGAGVVELAYGVIPSMQGRGLATAAAQTAVEFAWR